MFPAAIKDIQLPTHPADTGFVSASGTLWRVSADGTATQMRPVGNPNVPVAATAISDLANGTLLAYTGTRLANLSVTLPSEVSGTDNTLAGSAFLTGKFQGDSYSCSKLGRLAGTLAAGMALGEWSFNLWFLAECLNTATGISALSFVHSEGNVTASPAIAVTNTMTIVAKAMGTVVPADFSNPNPFRAPYEMIGQGGASKFGHAVIGGTTSPGTFVFAEDGFAEYCDTKSGALSNGLPVN